jgi:hypothetical protein
LNPYFTFARWNGAEWERIDGINGIINTMFVQDTTLILGGNLLYNNTQLNVIKWSPHSGFKPFGSGIANEVRDFVRFNDTLYAACRRSSSIDSINLIVRLVDDNWISLGPGPRMNSFSPFNHEVSFNTLCADGNKLMTGGSFFYDNMLWGKNTVCIKAPYFTDSAWFVLDSTVNKMVVFKKDFIVGGLFRYGSQNGAALNGICKRRAISLSAPQVALVNAFVIYPNPAQRAGTITVRNNFGADKFAILGIDGRLLSAGLLSGQSSRVLLPELSPGLYILVLANKEGRRAARSFTIE